jgi:hypothetical protein
MPRLSDLTTIKRLIAARNADWSDSEREYLQTAAKLIGCGVDEMPPYPLLQNENVDFIARRVCAYQLRDRLEMIIKLVEGQIPWARQYCRTKLADCGVLEPADRDGAQLEKRYRASDQAKRLRTEILAPLYGSHGEHGHIVSRPKAMAWHQLPAKICREDIRLPRQWGAAHCLLWVYDVERDGPRELPKMSLKIF